MTPIGSDTPERENGAVPDPNAFPPPRPGSLPEPPKPGESAAEAGWDWARVRPTVEEWYRPVLEPKGWLALAYLFVDAIVAPFMFGLMVAAGAVTFGLSFAGIGLLLIVPFFLFVGVMIDAECWLAAEAGFTIPRRPVARSSGAGPRHLLGVLGDRVRWRQIGFVATNLFAAPVLLAVGGIPASLVFRVAVGKGLFGTDMFGLGPEIRLGELGLLGVLAAAVLVGAIPRVALWAAGVKVQIARWFLAPDALEAAHARVSELSSQRDDIVDAVATERRRIERNLHDGVQQQLVAIGLDLGMAEHQIDQDPERARELLANARHKVRGSIGELRQLGRGLHPAILADRGIDAALSAVVADAPIPISVHVDPALELSTDVAETVYFVANEAVANVLKHARARVASVSVAKVAAVGDADGLLDAVTEHQPTFCLVDVRMPPTHTDEGLRAAIEIRRRYPTIAVLVLSQYVEERYAAELLEGDVAGVGYLLKDRVIDVDDFLTSVRRVAAGGSAVDAEVVSQILGRSRRVSELDRLTPREREVLNLMAEGLSNGGIAERLVVSAGAVEKHISNVFMKLGLAAESSAHRRVLAVLTYLRG